MWWLFWEDKKASSKMFSARVILRECENLVTTIFNWKIRSKMYHKTRDDTIQYNTTILERERKKEKKWRSDSAKKIVQRNGRKLKFSAASFFRRFCNTRSCRIAYSRYYLNGETIIRCGCGTRCFGASRATGAIEACRNTLNRRETHTRKK